MTCFQSAATLGECLDSLAFCDEIVVLDSGSTDAIRAIATERGARVDVRTAVRATPASMDRQNLKLAFTIER